MRYRPSLASAKIRDALADGEGQRGQRAVEHVERGLQPVARLQDWAVVDTDNGADGQVHLDVRGAVERVHDEAERTPRIREPDDVLLLLRGEFCHEPGGTETRVRCRSAQTSMAT